MGDNLKRKDGETLEEYQIRLSLGLLRREVGYEDLEWEDVKELLGSTEHRDTLRRKGRGILLYDDYIKTKTREQLYEEEYEKLLKKELEIKREKVKLQDLRTCLNKQIRENARKDNLVEILEEKLETIEPCILNDYKERSTSGKDGIMLLSDIHYGVQTYNAIDYYDTNICKEKMDYLIDKTIEYSLDNNIDKLYVCILGDEISGNIHTTTRIENRENIIEQILGVSNLLVHSIEKLSKYLPFVVVSMAQGNHSRVTANKTESLEQENFNRLIREFLKIQLSNISNVLVLENEDNGIIELNVKGYNVVGVHGHCDKVNSLDKLIEMFDYKVDYILMGHFHNAREFEENKTDVIINGCFSGDDYSKKLRLYNKPIQKLLIFTDEGKTTTYNINLNNYKR